MDGVTTTIIGGPRPSPPHRRATTGYTLVCEEPSIRVGDDVLVEVGVADGPVGFSVEQQELLRGLWRCVAA